MSRSDDLNWTAFRYVSGDLSPTERAAFETQLEADQAAREAVAFAVELGDCLVAAHDPQQASPATRVMRSRWRRGVSGRWATFVTAGCLLLACGAWVLWGASRKGSDDTSLATRHDARQNAPTDLVGEQETGRIAAIWAEYRQPLDVTACCFRDADDSSEAELPAAVVDDSASAYRDLFLDDEAGHGDGAGGEGHAIWIQAAVFGMASEGSEDGEMPESRGAL